MLNISNRKAQIKHNITLTPLMKFSFVTMEFAPLSNIRNKSKTRIPIIPIKRINSVKGSSRLSTRDRNHTVMLSIITLHLVMFLFASFNTDIKLGTSSSSRYRCSVVNTSHMQYKQKVEEENGGKHINVVIYFYQINKF